MTTTIRKPTPLDFSGDQFEIGDRAAAVAKQQRYTDKMSTFANELNMQTIPDVESVGAAAISARDTAQQYATDAANSADAAASSATTAQNAASTAAADATEAALAGFDAAATNAALATFEPIPGDNVLIKNKRYFLPAGMAATMPSTASDGDFIEFVPVGNLATTPATITFSAPVQTRSGSQLAAGTHSYNSSSTQRLTLKNNVWRF